MVTIDGKTLRGSYCRGKGKGAIHMLRAFSAANGRAGKITNEGGGHELLFVVVVK